ncbi:MAG: ABC transporter permease subunit, partial [Acidimicrobiales bacterium]
MIRLSVRQFRSESIVGFGALIVIAIALAITGPHLVHINDAFLKCKADNDCSTGQNPVTSTYENIQTALSVLTLVVPALIGIFFGAPLIARELETGTFRLAWTQSVTRTRWLVIKLAVVGFASMLVGGLLGLMTTWWLNPIDTANQNRFSPGAFGTHGIVPFGYAAFAFALGVTAGVIFRRTLPAMAVALFGFIAARLAVSFWVRPNLGSPVHASLPLNLSQGIGFTSGVGGGVQVSAPPVNLPNALVNSVSVVNSSGRLPSTQFLENACPGLGGPPGGQGAVSNRPLGGSSSVVQSAGKANQQFQDCIHKLSGYLHVAVVYQPANRYWPFQIYETLIFVGAAALLGSLSWWWIRHRLT